MRHFQLADYSAATKSPGPYRKGATLTYSGGLRQGEERVSGIFKTWFYIVLLLVMVAIVGRSQTSLNWWSPQEDLGIGDYARMCRLANGDWLALYTTNLAWASDAINIYKSTDTCRTWTQIAQVNETASNLDLGNGSMIQLSNGDLLLALRAVIFNASGVGTNFALRVYKSTNLGTNWSLYSTIDALTNNGTEGLYEPDLHLAYNGELVCEYADESYQPTYSQVISEKVSPDLGATWGTKTTAAADLNSSSDRPGMPQVTLLANGNYMMVFELTCCGAAYKTSSDGLNWAAGIGTLIPDQHTAPFALSMPDGRVFVTSGGGNTKVSYNYGSSWQSVTSAWYIANSYPSLYLTKPNEMAWFMGLKPPINTASMKFGSITPGPVELTTSRRTQLTLMDGRKVIFACDDPNGEIWENSENSPGGTWSGWQGFSGTGGFRRLDAMQNPDGTLVLFGCGDSSPLWVNWQTVSNGTWQSSFTNLGGTITDFQAFRYPLSAGGRYVVFATDGSTVWARSQSVDNSSPGSNWAAWSSFTGSGFTQFSTVLMTNNNAFVMMGCGNPGQVWLNYQFGYQQSWSGWLQMGGWYNTVRLFRYNDGRLTLFAGDDDSVWNITQVATNSSFTNWTGWEQLPGHEITQYDPVKLSDQRFSILGVNAGTSIIQNTQTAYNTNSWTGIIGLGGGGFDQIHGGQISDGRMYYFANGLGSPEWFRYQQVSNGVWYTSWTNLTGAFY